MDANVYVVYPCTYYQLIRCAPPPPLREALPANAMGSEAVLSLNATVAAIPGCDPRLRSPAAIPGCALRSPLALRARLRSPPPPPLPRNPYYKNERKTAEVHILRPFDADFYASHLRVVVTGFLRNELNFTTLEALIDMIQTDIRLAKNHLTSGSKDFALSDAAASFFAAPQPLPVPSA